MTILTASQAATYLGYSYSYFTRLAKKPGFPPSVALQLGNGRWRGWHSSALDTWVRQHPGNPATGRPGGGS